MLFTKSNDLNFLKKCLTGPISDLKSANYEFVAGNILKSINHFLATYCFFSSIRLRMRISWVIGEIKDYSTFSPSMLTASDVTMINMVIEELETFLNSK